VTDRTCVVCSAPTNLPVTCGATACQRARAADLRRSRVKQRWAADPEYRQRRTASTAASLVRTRGRDAPAWAVRLTTGA